MSNNPVRLFDAKGIPIASTGGKLPTADSVADGHLATIAGAISGGKMLCDTEVTATIDPSTLATSAKQLADGHNVTVDNEVGSGVYVRPGISAEFPLPTAQVTTLTPPAAITGFATSAKQDTLANVFGPTAPIPLNISFASVDAQTIIAAPVAGSRIRITSLFLSSATDVNVAIKSATTTIGTIYGMAFAKDWVQPLKLGTAEAFVLDAVTADQIYGQVCYYVEVV